MRKGWSCVMLCRSKNNKNRVAKLMNATEDMNLNQLKEAVLKVDSVQHRQSISTTCQNEKFTSTTYSASGASSTRTDVPATMELQIEGV